MAADLSGLWLALLTAFLVSGRGFESLHASFWLIPTLPLWAFHFRAYNLYRRPIRRFDRGHLDDLSSLFHALVVGTLCLWIYYRVLPVKQLALVEVAVFGALSLLLISVLRVAMRRLSFRLQGPEQVFVIAPIEDVQLFRRKLENHPEYEMTLAGEMTEESSTNGRRGPAAVIGQVEDLIASGQIEHLIVRLDARFLTQALVEDLMRLCHREGIRFGCFPGAKCLVWPGVELNHVEAVGILTSNPPVLSASSRLLKRGMDIALSALLLALFAPLVSLIAIAIKLTSPGSILYRQTRVGQHGQRFELIKFRTMEPNADDQVAELMKHSNDPDWLILDDDPRVTAIGRVLRRTSLDELPQLWNVLKGDMSLVGPRPLPERDDEAVRGWHRHRLDLMPGITGYWQVLGRNSIPFQEMLEIDYAYVANWSLWYDVRILAQTVSAVLTRRGAN